MPKKPTTRKRSRAPSKFSGRPSGREFNQCTECGGLVEDELINGDDSWCPHCKDTRLIVTDYGRIPMPSMYGRWQMREAERTKAAPIPAVQVPEASESSSLPPPLSPVSLTRKLTFLGDTTMKHFTTHTGTYSCLNCYIQYELTAEKSLRCDDCRGPLVKGTLEELGVDPDDLDDEDE